MNDCTDFVNNFFLRSENKDMGYLMMAMLEHNPAHPDSTNVILKKLRYIRTVQYL